MRNFKFLLALFLLLFTREVCVAQNWDWVAESTNSWHMHSYINGNGDAYFTHDRINIITSSSDSNLYSDYLISKFSKDGKRVCGFSLPLSNERHNTSNRIVGLTGNNENIYTILSTYDKITLNNKVFPSPIKGNNLILIKFDNNCNVLDANLIGRVSSLHNNPEVKIDKSENIYLSLAFDSFLVIDSLSMFVTPNNNSAVLLKIFPNGKLQWKKDINKNVWQPYQGIKMELDKKENIYIYNNSLNIFQKINSDGKLLMNYNDNNKILCHSIHFDKDNNLWLAGTYSGSIYINNQTIKTTASRTGIVLKYTENMDITWYQSIIYSSYSDLKSVITDSEKNIYVAFGLAGANTNEKIFLGSIEIENNSYKRQGFIKMDSAGQLLWIEYITSNQETQAGIPEKIYLDGCENLYVFGTFDEYGGGFTEPLYQSTFGKHKISSKRFFGYYIAKLNPDTLDFEVNESCEGIILKNTSDTTAYTSFEWTLPDGTKQFSRDAYIETNKYKDTVLVSLKGIKPNGCENVFTRKLKFQPMPKPVARFTIDSFTGCQWMGIRFYDSSYNTVPLNCADCQAWTWDFGDGTKKTANEISHDGKSYVDHIYTKPGTYKISLIFENLYCSDTFTLEKQITIIEAPKPGFTVNQTEGCAPLTVNITNQSIGQVDTYFYTSGDGQTSNQSSPTFIYTKPGKYFIKQQLKGPTECITKDSIQITIRAGYNQGAEPEILTATVTDSNYIKVSWKKNPVTAKNHLHRQSVGSAKTYTFSSADTFYVDKDVDVNKAFYTYTLYGTDSCGSTKTAPHKAQTILLENHSQTTEYNYLRWSPYQSWQNGVLEYKLQYKTDTQFIQLTNLSGNVNEHKDAQLYPGETREICYRIIATENAGNNQISQSNTVCMPFLPTIIVPNAFSPNNDSINDIFTFSAIGIESYQLSIYNRWGERIYSGNQNDKGWDGKFKNSPAPEGEYLYKLSAKPYQGKTIYQSGNLHLLR